VRKILDNIEYVELVRLIQIIDFEKNGSPQEIERKDQLEIKALRRQVIKAQLAAKYPLLANHLYGNDNPYCKRDKPYVMLLSR